MITFEVANGVTGYWQLLAKVLARGKPRSPRGKSTLELGPVTVVMHDVTATLPLGVGRNVSRRIAAAEAIQLIGNFSDYDMLVRASGTFSLFAEPDTKMFHGAYGIRIGEQLCHVVNKIRRDPETRQAMVTLWDPWRDNLPDKMDYPCTIALGFNLADDGRLDMSVLMRSQDVFWGTPYDWMQFTQVQQTIATVLGVRPGIYRHTTLSTHLYTEFTEQARKVVDTPPPLPQDREWQPTGLGWHNASMRDVIRRARRIAYAKGVPVDLTPSEEWYREHLRSVTE